MALHQACRVGDLELVKTLIQDGADVNVKTKGISPLFTAVRWGNQEIVKILLVNGADINAPHIVLDSEITPLWRAASYFTLLNRKSYIKIVKMFLQYSPNINLQFGQHPGARHLQFIKGPRTTKICELVEQFSKLHALSEWRPWNHEKFPSEYRKMCSTLVLLAKITKR